MININATAPISQVGDPVNMVLNKGSCNENLYYVGDVFLLLGDVFLLLGDVLADDILGVDCDVFSIGGL